MLSCARAFLLLSFLVSPAVAFPALSLTVQGPSAVHDIQNLRFKTAIQNTGNEELRLLNTPQSVLGRGLETDVFDVVHAGTGARPIFRGVKVKYSPARAARINAFTIIRPGETAELAHDLSARYNFTSSGQGVYTFTPFTIFTHVDQAGNLISIRPTPSLSTSASLSVPISINVSISGKLTHVSRDFATNSTSPLALPPRKRASFNECSSSQQSAIASAIAPAQEYAESAFAYASGINSGTKRYTHWFGEYSDENRNMIRSHFQRIMSNNQIASNTYDCTCDKDDVYAYVKPDQPGTMYICQMFFASPLTGTDSQAGTLVHESSHFAINGGTFDYAYGQDDCTELAQSNPSNAVMNADSHEYFAENAPFEL